MQEDMSSAPGLKAPGRPFAPLRAPGIALGEKGESKVLVATAGRVRGKIDAARAPIHIGDLLVTSNVSRSRNEVRAVSLSNG